MVVKEFMNFLNKNKNKMKKLMMYLLIALISATTFAQIDPVLMKANWRVGKEKTVYEHTIIRHEGNNDIGGITNIGYESLEQIIEKIEKRAEEEMWAEEEKNNMIESFKTYAQGGIINLYITRLTIHAANLEMFTVIVRDSTDQNEIYRENIERDIPNTPRTDSDYWWNYTGVAIPVEVSGTLFVYVIDKLGGDNNKFKFEIKL